MEDTVRMVLQEHLRFVRKLVDAVPGEVEMERVEGMLMDLDTRTSSLHGLAPSMEGGRSNPLLTQVIQVSRDTAVVKARAFGLPVYYMGQAHRADEDAPEGDGGAPVPCRTRPPLPGLPAADAKPIPDPLHDEVDTTDTKQ